MPWKEATRMGQRQKMVELYESGLYTKVDLARKFEISRPTVDLWLARSEEDGEWWEDRPPIPRTCPHRTDEAIARRIVEAKRKHPTWGPKKLIQLLEQEDPEIAWPVVSTAGAILDAEGLVQKRPRRREKVVRRAEDLTKPTESGEMMTADHKGQFRLGNGTLCFPLTINDPVSRYSYAIAALSSTSIANAQPVFERVFRKYGLPVWIKTDNGEPFCAARSLGGLSRLTVWWIKLGIRPVRTRPGSPWQNGAHERAHRTLKAETTRPPAQDMASQQKLFNRFQREYNTQRPHESLNGRAPATELQSCPRSFPKRIAPIEYPGHFEVRSVRAHGDIKFRGGLLYVSEALIRERVGLEEIDDGVWSIHFSFVELGRFDARTRKIF